MKIRIDSHTLERHLFKQMRSGRFYEQKRVEVIYTIEGDTIVTVTVRVFYGKWEEQG